MALPFKLIPSRHRLGLVEGDMQERLLEARRTFARDLPDDLKGAVEFFDAERYNAAASVQDNILFGKVRYGQSGAAEKVQGLIEHVVEHLSLRQTLIALGLDHSVGVGGARLSGAQRQKLALGRALLKHPDLLILNEATSTLDGSSQATVHAGIKDRFAGKGLIWAPHRPSLARDCDEVIVLKDGRVEAHGTFEDLQQPGGPLESLLAAE
jgi:ABC-type multidrug transport system fused ATPase/permease subunit